MLTTEQHAARAKGLGGSDIATILNLNPYKTNYELWQEKSGRVEPEDISDKFAIRRGNDMEALVCKWFEQETGLKNQRLNKTLTNPDAPFMVGHIDRRIIGVKEGLEAKTANWRVAFKFGEQGTDQVPPPYLIQCHSYMILTGWKVWHLAADLGGDFATFRIEADETLANHIKITAKNWWEQHIINDVEPVPQLMRELDIAYAIGDTGKVIEADAETIALHDNLKTSHKAKKALDDEIDELKRQLKSTMSDATTVMASGKKLASWNNSTRKIFNKSKFEKYHPDLYANYVEEIPTRILRPNYR